MNSDVAYEILRYLNPIDRCRYRLINRSFNEAALIWWRRTSTDVDFSVIVTDNNRRRRSKILSCLRFLGKYCSSTIRYLRNFSVDDRLIDEIVDQSISSNSDLRSMFDNLEFLELRCLRIENYDSLAKFLNLFRSLIDLKIVGRYPMAVESWDGDETKLCAAIVDLNRLRCLNLCEMELKVCRDFLNYLNSRLK